MESTSIIAICIITLLSTIGTIILLAAHHKTERLSYSLLIFTCGPLCFSLYNPYLVIIAFPVVIIIHLLFICYWGLIFFKKNNFAKLFTFLIGFVLVSLTSSPWLLESCFTKSQSEDLLKKQSLHLLNDFELFNNSYHGYLKFTKSFTVSISDKDYQNLKELISSKIPLGQNKYTIPTDSSIFTYYEDNGLYGIKIHSSNNMLFEPNNYNIQLRKNDVSSTSYYAQFNKNFLHYFSEKE
jgi:hypothetical protein